MTTHHGGAGLTGEDRDLHSPVEDAGNIDKAQTMTVKAQTAQILQLLLEDQRQMATLVTSCLTARKT